MKSWVVVVGTTQEAWGPLHALIHTIWHESREEQDANKVSWSGASIAAKHKDFLHPTIRPRVSWIS